MVKRIDLEELLKGLLGGEDIIHEGLAAGVGKKYSFLKDYIKKEEFEKKIKELKRRGLPPNETADKLKEYIATGELLNNRGKEIFLKINWERPHGFFERIGKGLYTGTHPWMWRRGKRGFLKDVEKYKEGVMGAFSDLYNIMTKGEYEDVLPEKIKDDIKTLKELEFYLPAVNVFYEKKIINARKRSAMLYTAKKVMKHKAKETYKTMRERIAESAMSAVFLILGIGLLAFSSANITGFVVVGNEIPVGYPVAAGFILLIIALCISLIRRKPKKLLRRVLSKKDRKKRLEKKRKVRKKK